MKLQKDELLMEVQEIKKIMDLLSDLFPLRTSYIYAINDDQYTSEIAGNNGDFQEYCRIVQEELKHKCIECDRYHFNMAKENRAPLLYQCYNGLYEMFLPLYIDNYLTGFLHFGQVRSEENFDEIAEKYSLNEHSKIRELEKIYISMPVVNKKQLILIAKLFKHYADLIIQNKLVGIRTAKPEFYLKKYVEDNFDKDISVHTAAKFVGRSTSFVTHKFREIYKKTFHEFLCDKRIEHAKELLRKYSIEETYQKCGYCNRYHFSKIFKKLTGKTPGEYQLEIQGL